MTLPQIVILIGFLWIFAHAAWIHTGNKRLGDALLGVNFTIGAAMLLGTIISL